MLGSSGVEALDYKAVPLLNTALLLGSGMLVTWAHYGIIRGGGWSA